MLSYKLLGTMLISHLTTIEFHNNHNAIKPIGNLNLAVTIIMELTEENDLPIKHYYILVKHFVNYLLHLKFSDILFFII